MTSSRQALGRAGEDLVAHYLESQGFEVEARNWVCQGGEIDLVAHRGTLRIFVEVRSVSTPFLKSALWTITARKQRLVARAAIRYLEKFPWKNGDLRFDAAAVNFACSPPALEYVENAFVPDEAF